MWDEVRDTRADNECVSHCTVGVPLVGTLGHLQEVPLQAIVFRRGAFVLAHEQIDD